MEDLRDITKIDDSQGSKAPGLFYEKKVYKMVMKLYNEAIELFGEMRDPTPDELEQLGEYLNSISEPTGLNMWEILDEQFMGRSIQD